MALGLNLESLRPLVALVDFLQNPEQFKSQLVDLKTTLASYDKIVKVYPTVEAADAYMAKVKAYGVTVEAEFMQRNAALSKNEEALATRIAKAEADVTMTRAQLASQKQELNALAKTLAEQTVVQNARQEAQNARNTELNFKEASLTQQEQDMLAAAKQARELFA